LSAAQRGDRDAFEGLVRSAQREVYSLAWRLTGSEAEADDITQESFISAWKHLESFRGEISFKAWVLKIAMNKCRSFWRWSNIRRLVSLDRDEEDEEAVPLQERLKDESSPQPEQAFDSQARAELINQALNNLSEKQREAALLRGQGLGIGEIAAIMRTAQGTIKAHLFEARRKLASALKEAL
ncbi:MAG TPA: sigma-70 family RNA polymerase sigma factor, partial [Elusimicrobiales bacterium]|nr:sigma-70 family RNA polymerase sigma factor [Elusimicrobiales bacterium]